VWLHSALTAAALAATENRREIAAMATFIVMSDFGCVRGVKEREGNDEYKALVVKNMSF
jgi:hypothetical protein